MDNNSKVNISPPKIPRYKHVTVVDQNGEIISDVTQAVRSRNGGHFVISYTEKMCDFIKNVSNGAAVRVFLFLAHRQSYGGADHVFGCRCSRKFLAESLRLTPKTIYSALEFLQSEYLVNELRISGQLEFMVNPDYITCGVDKAARVREWNFRWQVYHKRNSKKA